ncbi:CHASE2 domain-containing protein [Xanthomonas sacchari]|nr:CHASE2 domain-containing protein [Xanthomonas sacchari]UYK65512.1 CHASE2 domain-containing protein [Xanthomonas sacchari]
MFSEPDLQHADDDARLAAALRRNGRTVLPVIGSAGGADMPQELLPIPAIATAAAALAHTDLAVDADGIARGVYLRAGLGSAHWPALAAALTGRALPPAPATTDAPYAWHRADYVGLRFAAPSAPFAQVSYVDVVQGRIPPQSLRGRLAIVGVTATGLGQRVMTPMSDARWMSAPEYQANVGDAVARRPDPAVVAHCPGWPGPRCWCCWPAWARSAPVGADGAGWCRWRAWRWSPAAACCGCCSAAAGSRQGRPCSPWPSSPPVSCACTRHAGAARRIATP